jgi:hypothetical protein
MHDVAPGGSKIRWGNAILSVLVIILFFLNFYTKTLFFRPGSVHQWRQTDCLSIAKNYYEEGMNFFQPRIHYQGVEDGKAVSECPILNYTAAALWHIFGEHEFIYRLLEYIIFLLAIYTLFNTLLLFSHSIILSLFTVSIFLTSPLLAYYGLNFIADVPAFSMGIISFCLFYRFYHHKRLFNFYLALVIGMLAVLIKASALVGYSLVLFFSLIDLLQVNRFFCTQKLFYKKLAPAIAICASLLIIFAWYRFAIVYNGHNSNNIFLLTVLPIWEMDEQQLIYNLKILFNNLFPVFLNKPIFFLVMSAAIFVAGKFRQLDVFLRYAFAFSAIFFLCYLLFFFQVFGVHDYYLVNIMVFPVITMFCLVSILAKSGFVQNNGAFARTFLILSIVFNSFHCAAIYRLRTIEDDKMVYWFPFISEEEKNLAKYFFWDYGNSIEHIEDFKPVLRQAGIKRTDHVLSIPDFSFDISLYFMDQKGYTITRDHLVNDSTVLDPFMKKVRYLILSDTTLKHTKAFRRMRPKMLHYFSRDHVDVYKVIHHD